MYKLNPPSLPFFRFLTGAVLIALMLSGCASLWQPAPDQLTVAGCSFQPPGGWMRLSTPAYEMFSKDGPYLQYIFFQQKPLGQVFRNTRQTLDQTLLPQEAAQIVADNLRLDPKIAGFNLLATQPATVDGHRGFKLLYTYKDRQGVTLRSIYYGVVLEHAFFNLRYTAAERHYYEKDLKAFQRMIETLHFPS